MISNLNCYNKPKPLWQDTHEVSQGLEHETLTHMCICEHDISLIASQSMDPIQEPNTWQGQFFHKEQAYEVWSQSHDFLKNVTHTHVLVTHTCMCQPLSESF